MPTFACPGRGGYPIVEVDKAMRTLGRRRVLIARLLRLVVLSSATLAAAALLCWWLGWSGRRGLSDALFLVGGAELIAAGAAVWGSPTDTSGGLSTRLWANMRESQGDMSLHRQIASDMLDKQAVGFTALGIGLLTVLAAVLVSL